MEWTAVMIRVDLIDLLVYFTDLPSPVSPLYQGYSDPQHYPHFSKTQFDFATKSLVTFRDAVKIQKKKKKNPYYFSHVAWLQ